MLYKGEVDGAPFTDYGVIDELSAPTEYSYRYWSDNHGSEPKEENYLMISYRLKKLAEGTCLTMEQSNIKSTELYELSGHRFLFTFLLDILW